MATSITSAAELFITKCVDAVSEVATLTQKKIQDPGSIIDFQVSGALSNAVSGDLGPLKSFGESYVKNNSSALAVQALKVTGLEQKAQDALNIFYNIISSAIASYNDLLLQFTKQVTRKAIEEIENKQKIREDLIKKLNAYINTLEFMREGPSVFDDYLEQLRDALIEIDEAHRELVVVSSTFKSSNLFLDKRFENVKTKLGTASTLIRPSDNPYLDPDFLANQVIISKKTTGATRTKIVDENFGGVVDPGLPDFLEGGFSSAQVGDLITVSFTPEDEALSPINNGEYKIVRKLSDIKVQLSPRLRAAGLLGTVVDPSSSFENSELVDNSTNFNVVNLGDRFIWNDSDTGADLTATVVSIKTKERRLVLDKQLSPQKYVSSENGKKYLAGSYRIERGSKRRPQVVLTNRDGNLFQGEEIPVEGGTPVLLFNSSSGVADIIENVQFKIERKDGLQFDHKTFIDQNAEFTQKTIRGHFLKILSPSSIKGSYKIVSTSGDTKIIVASAIKGEDGPVENVEYEIKADLGIPTDADQFANIMAIPAMTSSVVLAGKGYFKSNLLANGYITAFQSALDQLLDSLPSALKQFVLNMFEEADGNLNNLKGNMATLLNGSPNRFTKPSPSFKPNPINISSYAFKWNMDLTLVRGVLDNIPEEALAKLNLSQAPLNAYRTSVERMQKIDNYTAGTSVVKGEDGREDVGQLENQLFSLLTEGNTLIFTGSLREEIISLGRSIVRNLELSRKRDNDVLKILHYWNNFPIPLEEELEEMMGGIKSVLKNLGLDKMADLFDGGNFADLFSINNGKAATYVGSALIGLALLKECFDTPEDSEELDKIVTELEKEEQLLDVKLSINFDLAIFNKLLECTKFENLSLSLNLKEILCGIVAESSVGQKLSSVFDAVDSGTAGPGEKVASNLVGL